jgi:hypothetical protein
VPERAVDLLADGAGRILHRREQSTRLMRHADLRGVLDGLVGVGAVTKPSFGGLVARFTAKKNRRAL